MKTAFLMAALMTLTTQAFAKKSVVCEDDSVMIRFEWNQKNKDVMSGYLFGEENTLSAKAITSSELNQKVFVGKLTNAEGSVDMQLTLTDEKLLEVKSLDPQDPLVWMLGCR